MGKFWEWCKKGMAPLPFDLDATVHMYIHLVMSGLFLIIFLWTTITYYFTSYSQFRYDNKCSYENTSDHLCHLTIKITETYPAGSYIYLGLKNWRQTYPRI